MKALRTWILAARPKTLIASIAPVIIGCALAVRVGQLKPSIALAALLGAIFIQVGTNLTNDYYDYIKGCDTKDRNGPLRVTQAGLISPGAVLRGGCISFLIATIFGFYLVYHGGLPILMIGLISIALGFLYTAGPYPLAYTGLGDIFVVIFFGPIATAGTFFVQTGYINELAILAGLPPGLLSIAILTVNNLRDKEGDTLAKKRTLVVRLGDDFGKAEYLACFWLSCIIPAVAVFEYQISLLAVSILILPLLFSRTIKQVLTFQERSTLDPCLASTAMALSINSLVFSLSLAA